MRGWHELVAVAGDPVPGGVPVLGLGLLMLTAVVATLWYWWPDWLPGRRRGGSGGRRRRDRRRGRDRPGWRPRWSRWRLRWRLRRLRRRLRWRRRRRDPGEPAAVGVPGEELPEVPAGELVQTADELAAAGRYREAVRERLRAIVRALVERGVVANHPGWTVTELAAAAGQARPAVAAPLGAASDVFSGIWYGQRPALAGHDAAMRQYADQVRAALDRQEVPV